MDDFWHKNLDRIPHITGSFIEDFASATLPMSQQHKPEAGVTKTKTYEN